jgi:hypothetical protein
VERNGLLRGWLAGAMVTSDCGRLVDAEMVRLLDLLMLMSG